VSEAEENLKPMQHAAQNRCFGCGQANPQGLHLEFFLSGDGGVVAQPTVPDTFEGPQGYLHGGIIATLLDETMSKCARARGLTTMTRQLEVDYLRPVPSGAPLRVEGRWLRGEGRRHWLEAEVRDAAGIVLAQGRGVFVDVKR
jgi:uncharacterized protein (TIGR00369 family)